MCSSDLPNPKPQTPNPKPQTPNPACVVSNIIMFGDLFYELHKKANICLMKHSNDNARRRDQLITCEGRENGPDCVFRFLPTVGTLENPAYPQSTQDAFKKLQVGRFNDVKPQMGRRINKHNMSKVSLALEEYHDQLETDIIYQFRASVPDQRIILLAANNDVLHPCLRALMHGNERVPLDKTQKITGGFISTLLPEKDRRLKVIIFSNMLDVRPMHEGFKIHAGCSLRKYIGDHPEDDLDVVYFGVDRNLVTKDESNFLNSIESSKIRISIHYSDQIDKSEIPIIDQMTALLPAEKGQNSFILFNMEALNVHSI